MLNKFLLLIPAFLVFISFGCTSSQKATEYPQRYIDQPYTLPDDVAVWGSVGSIYSERFKDNVYSQTLPIPIPLYWEYAVNDNLTLEIPIIPIGLTSGARLFALCEYGSLSNPCNWILGLSD